MKAPVEAPPIPMTNLETDEAKMHVGLGDNLQAAGHPGQTKPPHEEHPLTGTLKELGPYIISGLKETFKGVEPDSHDRVSGSNADITSIYEAKEDKRSLPSEEDKQKKAA